jgi:hypothetical protein
MISRMRACYSLCVWLHRVREQLECRENARAGHGFLARPSVSAATSCAARAWHVTIEGSPSYASMLLLPLLLLVLLLLLLHARLSLQRHSCCYRRYQVATPLATRALLLPRTVLKQRRALPSSARQMLREEMEEQLLSAGARFASAGTYVAEAGNICSRRCCTQHYG